MSDAEAILQFESIDPVESVLVEVASFLDPDRFTAPVSADVAGEVDRGARRGRGANEGVPTRSTRLALGQGRIRRFKMITT